MNNSIANESSPSVNPILRHYDFSTEQVPRFDYRDPRVGELISNKQPVIVTGTDLITPAFKWNLDYLAANIGDEDFTVYESDTYNFKYFDDKKVKGSKVRPPMKRIDMKFVEFVKRLRNPKDGKRIYLQQMLTDKIGRNVVLDFLRFNWDWVNDLQQRHQWGHLTTNLLLIGQPGNVTPCHYDEQENVFAQVTGEKRVILFSPEHFPCLYPYPVFHQHDRQSQVDFENPDYENFPRFKEAKGLESILGPGDVLYLPMYWWHHFESLDGDFTTSITFWYKSGKTEKIEYPLSASQKVAVSRNIEKMITDVLQDPEVVTSFMQDLVLGRYT